MAKRDASSACLHECVVALRKIIRSSEEKKDKAAYRLARLRGFMRKHNGGS